MDGSRGTKPQDGTDKRTTGRKALDRLKQITGHIEIPKLGDAEKATYEINEETKIKTKSIADKIVTSVLGKKLEGAQVFRAKDGDQKVLMIVDKDDKLVGRATPEQVAKIVGQDAEKHAIAQHLKVDGLTIRNINNTDINIDGNQYVIKDQKTGEAWLFRKDQLDKATRDKIDRDSDFGQRDPAKAKNSFPLSESMHQAVIDNAVAVGEVAPGSKVVGWSEDKWAIADEADGKIKIFDLRKERPDVDDLDYKIIEDTEFNAVKKYVKLGDKPLTEVKFFDENDNTKYKVRTADTPDGEWQDLDKKDIHSDILAKIDAEKKRIDPENIKEARIIMGVKDWNDLLKDKEKAFEKARSIRRWGLRFASGLEQLNTAGAMQSQNIDGALDSIMQMSGNPNQNQPMTIEATHRLMKGMEHHYKDWKNVKKTGLKIIAEHGAELEEKHGITKEGLETLDKDITRKFEQLVKKYPDAKLK